MREESADVFDSLGHLICKEKSIGYCTNGLTFFVIELCFLGRQSKYKVSSKMTPDNLSSALVIEIVVTIPMALAHMKATDAESICLRHLGAYECDGSNYLRC